MASRGGMTTAAVRMSMPSEQPPDWALPGWDRRSIRAVTR